MKTHRNFMLVFCLSCFVCQPKAEYYEKDITKLGNPITMYTLESTRLYVNPRSKKYSNLSADEGIRTIGLAKYTFTDSLYYCRDRSYLVELKGGGTGFLGFCSTYYKPLLPDKIEVLPTRALNYKNDIRILKNITKFIKKFKRTVIERDKEALLKLFRPYMRFYASSWSGDELRLTYPSSSPAWITYKTMQQAFLRENKDLQTVLKRPFGKQAIYTSVHAMFFNSKLIGKLQALSPGYNRKLMAPVNPLSVFDILSDEAHLVSTSIDYEIFSNIEVTFTSRKGDIRLGLWYDNPKQNGVDGITIKSFGASYYNWKELIDEDEDGMRVRPKSVNWQPAH